MFTRDELLLLQIALDDYNNKTNDLIRQNKLELFQALTCTKMAEEIKEKINNILSE
jgi:hypothetical protein